MLSLRNQVVCNVQFNAMRSFFRGFLYAFNGIKYALTGRNMRFHAVVAVLVILAGVIFSITATEWLACILSISLIFSLEAINTAIECLCNHVTPEVHHNIKIIKDVAAGAVLLLAIGVSIVGLIIFVPYIIALF